MGSDDHDNLPLIKVENLAKYFPVRKGLFGRVEGWVKAVDCVNLEIRKGETLGLVGESGCGKTTLGLTIIRLLQPTSGAVFLEGTDLFELKGRALKAMRREMQIVFQDPYSSLDPRMPVGQSVGEGLRIHRLGSKAERDARVVDLLRTVGLEDYHAKRFPHQFSGGQRQRIGIARALAVGPRLIVADEPVSALDVSIQAQMLNLLRKLQREFQLTYLFIAHNMSVVEHISDRVMVMYLGKSVELAPSRDLFRNPLHPYTQVLMSSIPVPDPRASRERIILQGDVPSPLNPPGGCRFHPRCHLATKQCAVEEPEFRETRPGHWTACWLVDQISHCSSVRW